MVWGPILAVQASPLLPSHIHTSPLRHCYYIGLVGASKRQNGRRYQQAALQTGLTHFMHLLLYTKSLQNFKLYGREQVFNPRGISSNLQNVNAPHPQTATPPNNVPKQR